MDASSPPEEEAGVQAVFVLCLPDTTGMDINKFSSATRTLHRPDLSQQALLLFQASPLELEESYTFAHVRVLFKYTFNRACMTNFQFTVYKQPRAIPSKHVHHHRPPRS